MDFVCAWCGSSGENTSVNSCSCAVTIQVYSYCTTIVISAVETCQVAVLHNDLATALDAAGKHIDAEYHVRASLAIMTDPCTIDSDSDVEYSVRVYYNLGVILSHQGKKYIYT